jgi:hypothetical protein
VGLWHSTLGRRGRWSGVRILGSGSLLSQLSALLLLSVIAATAVRDVSVADAYNLESHLAHSNRATVPVTTPTPVPVPINKPHGPPPGILPQVFAVMYVWEHGRWMMDQFASLYQPILFNLAVQTSIHGWARVGGVLEVFKTVPVRNGVLGDLQPAKHPTFRLPMSLVARSHGYTHFRRRLVFSSPAMVGQLVALVRTTPGPGGSVDHFLYFTIRASGK